MLTDNDMDEALRAKVMGWFTRVNRHSQKNPAAAVGHAYFSAAAGEASLHELWEYQLKYLIQRAFRRDESTRADLETAWRHIFAEMAGSSGSLTAESGPEQQMSAPSGD